MHDAIKLILLSSFAVPSLAGCSGEPNPDQNVIITENVPADAEIEALPVDEGGTTLADTNEAEVDADLANAN